MTWVGVNGCPVSALDTVPVKLPCGFFRQDGNRADPMRRQMDRYSTIVKKLAAKHKAILVDTQAAFDVVLKHTHPMSLAWDRVHPNHIGHAIIARAFLKAVGFEN